MLKKLTNNIGLKLLSLVIAAIVWLVVVNIDDPVSSRTYNNIKVSVVNQNVVTDEGKVFNILDNSDNISVVVKAKRSILDSLSADDFVATADMKEMDVTLGLVPIEVGATKNASKIEEISSKTKNLRVSIEDYGSKQFAISGSVSGTPAEGFAVGDISITPNVLKVSGPASSIELVNKVVVKIDVEGMGTKLNLRLAPVLLDETGAEIKPSGVSVNYEAVDVEVTMVHTKEIPIEFSVTGTPAAGYSNTGTECSPKSILVKGSTDALAKIDKISLPSNLFNINGATQSVQKTVDISEYLPKGVEPVDPKQDSVVISIMIESIERKTVSIPTSRIKTNNLTQGLAATFSSAPVEIEVSGWSDVIEKLTEASFTLEVDLSDYTHTGTFPIPVKVTAPSGVTVLNEVKVETVISGGP